jgi:hypothetical protein
MLYSAAESLLLNHLGPWWCVVAPALGDILRKEAVAMSEPMAVDLTILEARRAAQSDLNAVIEVLVREFAAVVPAGAVISQVTLSRERLLRAGVRAGLAPAVEAMTRSRLRELLPAAVGA